ncbi:unnamed protein product [Linum tenue]|uniref:Uncharacterized protein n=1 Tax=Linum tenue TaxID=586396 RepID=A0AAV0R976_9ROSI|nr:unnamed protein product [Linum tenue]
MADSSCVVNIKRDSIMSTLHTQVGFSTLKTFTASQYNSYSKEKAFTTRLANLHPLFHKLT